MRVRAARMRLSEGGGGVGKDRWTVAGAAELVAQAAESVRGLRRRREGRGVRKKAALRRQREGAF